jgi:hypothetical protein
MNELLPFRYRTSQAYGWPFYVARKVMRGWARRLLAAADALSGREKYPVPLFCRPLLPRNAQLKDVHRGRRCFVIGNGPSLARQDVEPLAGELTFAMNGFLNHPAIGRIKPTYYCLVDPSYFDGSASSDRFLGRLFETVTESHFILPYASAETILGRWKVPAGRATFVTFAGNLATASLRTLDLTRPLPCVLNCAQLAIMVALYAGCSPVYLMGMDHDWAAHRGTETHFYPQKTIENHPVAHGEWDRYPYLTILDDCLKVWRGYATLRRRAESAGQNIINCSDGGFLDVFDRADYRDLVNTRSAPSPTVQAAA